MNILLRKKSEIKTLTIRLVILSIFFFVTLLPSSNCLPNSNEILVYELIKTQDEGGYWKEEGFYSIESTSKNIIALIEFYDATKNEEVLNSIERGKDFLISKQNSWGSWGKKTLQFKDTAHATLSLLKYSEIFGEEEVYSSIIGGSDWINGHCGSDFIERVSDYSVILLKSYEISGEETYLKRSDELIDIITNSQESDGGFPILIPKYERESSYLSTVHALNAFLVHYSFKKDRNILKKAEMTYNYLKRTNETSWMEINSFYTLYKITGNSEYKEHAERKSDLLIEKGDPNDILRLIAFEKTKILNDTNKIKETVPLVIVGKIAPGHDYESASILSERIKTKGIFFDDLDPEKYFSSDIVLIGGPDVNIYSRALMEEYSIPRNSLESYLSIGIRKEGRHVFILAGMDREGTRKAVYHAIKGG